MIYCIMEDGVMAIDDGRPGEETIVLDPALVAALEDEHGHTCPNCGNRWRHKASDITARKRTRRRTRARGAASSSTGRTTPMTTKTCTGSPPKTCDVCGEAIDEQFVDGKTKMGPWGILCLDCHVDVGVGLGTGKGQRYRLMDGRWVKIEG